ncbi:MAG: pyridoxine 5'-phosphate synthase [Candidatus Omnitrophica bacterium]|nr:pyridoxine 5'-phosphate synthase [Candidatus Omnitrophota bacterium]MDD5574688.1 pyridoxine 5'-phosphate synthase [Candidatus Omnitrophota bacterium]
MPLLGVNIDHIATLRQQRRAPYPDLVLAARACENAGADSIVAHLREDRRHIQDADVFALRKHVTTRFNLEMALSSDIVRIACRLKPDQVTLVPERRQELTTEGGLDVVRNARRIAAAARRFKKRNIGVSLFIEPSELQVKAAGDIGIGIVELHTGAYAESSSLGQRRMRLKELREACAVAGALGLVVNAGHGLDYENVCPVASMAQVHELNIGYAIVCHSLFVGLEQAVRQMKALAKGSRRIRGGA